LPEGTYRLDAVPGGADPSRVALGWALGTYAFTQYREKKPGTARLVWPEGADRGLVDRLATAIFLARDLITTPASDMGPEELAAAAVEVAQAAGAKHRVIAGDALLKENYPTIHAVGRASDRAPRLVDISWGDLAAPKVTLVGKGVCFDTGGLDLKPSDGMRWMKKDMGGAAHAIALAGLVMETKLPVRLTLLVPAVENAVAGDAMRPGDVVVTRGGHSVEIDNTDAEGRLVLCDALAYAAEQKPELIIDFATLTGAARVALGPDLPALFANDDALAEAALSCGNTVADPLWRLPLWRPYRKLLESYVADFANAGASRHAGAITAALFMERFIPEGMPWLHLDTYSWNDGDRPGRPRGGEAMGLRAMFALLSKRYG
jgi:leucyl aminopeptidase